MIKFSNKYLVVFGAFLIELTLGHLYTSGNFESDIVNYMKKYSVLGNLTSYVNTPWIFGAISLGTGASLSLGGYLELKFGAWISVLIGSWLMSLNFGLMYFTLRSYLSIVIITFGLFGGIGVGIAYGVALGAAAKCFNKNRGLIFGIIISGFGLSAAFSDTLHLFIKDISKLPMYFAIMGSIYFVIQLFAAILIKRKPDKSLVVLDESSVNYFSFNSEMHDNLFNTSPNFSQRHFKPHQLIFEYDFWSLWFIMLLVSADDTIIASLYNISLNPKLPTNCLTYISIIVSIFNCLGRIFWGYLFDKIQFKKLMIIMTLTNAIFIGTIPALSKLPHTIYGIWFSIINFFIGGYFSVFPSICAKLFGMEYFVWNYGMIFTSCSVSSTIVSLVSMSINEYGGNDILFYSGGGLSLLATMITIIFRGRSLIFHENY